MRKLKVLAFGLATIVLASCNSSKNSTKLAFNLPKGKVYEYVTNMEMDQEAGGQKGHTTMKAIYLMEVTAETDSVKTVKTTFDRMAMDMDMGFMKASVDSDAPDTAAKMDMAALQSNPAGAMQSIMGGMFRAMKGKSFTMKMNRQGKVESVEGVKELGQAMMNGINVPDDVKPVVQQSFAQQFDDEKLKQTFQSYDIFPNKEIKVGDTWERTGSVSGMNIKSKYTVKSIEGSNATLDVTSDMDLSGIKGTQAGTLLVDIPTGLIVKGDLQQHFTGQMKMDSKISITGKEKK